MHFTVLTNRAILSDDISFTLAENSSKVPSSDVYCFAFLTKLLSENLLNLGELKLLDASKAFGFARWPHSVVDITADFKVSFSSSAFRWIKVTRVIGFEYSAIDSKA